MQSNKQNPNRCSILVKGDELVELKRHAHEIPHCPGLARRMQKCNGNKPFILSRDELDWLVSTLVATLDL